MSDQLTTDTVVWLTQFPHRQDTAELGWSSPRRSPRAKECYREEVFTAGLLCTRDFKHFVSFSVHDRNRGKVLFSQFYR